MSTLPTSSALDDFGGIKQDYSQVTDPTTDRSAAEVNSAFASMASASRTSIRAYLEFTGLASGNPPVNFHNAHWGSSLSVLPTIVRNSTGNYTITFPASITDPLGNVQSVNLITGQAGLEGTVPGFVTLTKATPNSFTCLLFNAAGTASDLTTTNIQVWII